jgi:hypothetical protein
MIDLRTAEFGSLWVNKSGDTVRLEKLNADGSFRCQIIETGPDSHHGMGSCTMLASGQNWFGKKQLDFVKQLYTECPW